VYYFVAGVGTVLRVLALAYAPAIYVAPLDSLQLLTVPLAEKIFRCCGETEQAHGAEGKEVEAAAGQRGHTGAHHGQTRLSNTVLGEPRPKETQRLVTRHLVERGIALLAILLALIVIGLHHKETNFTFEEHRARWSDVLVVSSAAYFVPTILFSVYSWTHDLPRCYRAFPVMLLHVSVAACLNALQIYILSVLLTSAVAETVSFNAAFVAVVLFLLFLSVLSMLSMARIYRCYSLDTVMPIFYTMLTGFVFYIDLIYRPSTADKDSVLTAGVALALVIPAFYVMGYQHNLVYLPPSGATYWW
jgi:hypothetical protein